MSAKIIQPPPIPKNHPQTSKKLARTLDSPPLLFVDIKNE